MKITIYLFSFSLSLISINCLASSLFEEASSSLSPAKSIEFNGFIKANTYIGREETFKNGEMKQTLGEISLKAQAKKGNIGDAFAEVKVKKEVKNGSETESVQLKEAYVNTYFNNFDLRLGHQIVVWGKADGINPTNNITPIDSSILSPDEDDRRLANFLLRGYYNFLPMRLEFLWIPYYKSSIMPNISLPSNLTIAGTEYPGSNLKNQSTALKLLFEGDTLDASISYFNGYSLTPGLVPQGTSIFKRTYRQKIFGLDFSSSIFSPYGLRGEVAYKKADNYKQKEYVPLPDLQYILGIDKEFWRGDLSIIAQYIGRQVSDWKELDRELSTYQVDIKNRLISGQTEKTTHSASLRVAYKMLYETLEFEIPGMYNFTSKEWFIRPKLTYDLADDMECSIGAEYYTGPRGTLFALAKDSKRAGFVELKISF